MSMSRLPRTRCAIGSAAFLKWASAIMVCSNSVFASATTVKHAAWGQDSTGKPVELYTLQDAAATVTVATFGARLVSVQVPDRAGTISNVLISRNSIEEYGGPFAFNGATVGRYANRIAGASVHIGDATYALSKNNGDNTLHGGAQGFHVRVWDAKVIRDGVTMSLVSPDGDMGFPGQLTVEVSFTLQHHKDRAELHIAYQATTTKPTVENLTNHAYFNLANDADAPVLEDKALIQADAYTPTDSTGIPTGVIAPVADTPLDFRRLRAFGNGIPDRGYDNNFVLRSHDLRKLAAEVDDPSTGRTLRVYTTEPGLQLFVPFAPPAVSDAAVPARPERPRVQAFCLETQHFPDSPHHPEFPSTLLSPEETFTSETVYVFGVAKESAR